MVGRNRNWLAQFRHLPRVKSSGLSRSREAHARRTVTPIGNAAKIFNTSEPSCRRTRLFPKPSLNHGIRIGRLSSR